MSDRGMKKWLAFRALNVQEEALRKLKKNRQKVPKPHLSGDQAALIDQALHTIEGHHVYLTYYEDGMILTTNDLCLEVKRQQKTIVLATKTIAFSQLIELTDLDF